ncbi:MAG: hypothetical protein ACXWZP_04540 [Gaiellaceae bacterium]
MRSWHRILLGGLLVAAVAAAGIALNFALLGLTQEDSDPVGKLSPRAVFTGSTGTTTSPATTTSPSTTTDDDDRTTTGDGDSSGHGDGDKHDDD